MIATAAVASSRQRIILAGRRLAGRAEVLIALAVLLAYATSLGGGFVWIDHVEIEHGGYRVRSAEDLGSLWRLTLDL